MPNPSAATPLPNRPKGPTRLVPAFALGELVAGEPFGLTLAGWPVLLLRQGDTVLATIDRCSHAAQRLSGGQIKGGAISCPAHGARFDPVTGRCVGGRYFAILTFAVEIVGDMVHVALPERAPSISELPVA